MAATSLAIPVLAGFTAIGLHGAFRYPMNLPGHHGLEFMALLTGSMLIGNDRRSGYLFSLGAGIGMPLFGILNPLNILSYLLPGIIAGLLRMPQKRAWLNALAGGAAYGSIALFRILAHVLFGIPVASFVKFGYAIPLINFFTFGLLGSLVAIGVMQLSKSVPRNTP